MPAYSFKERFCSMVLDGSKPHTIRAARKGRSRHARIGEKVFLYFGMRTKHCRKLGEGTCHKTLPILITEKYIRIYSEDKSSYMDLVGITADRLAWKDGFRPEGHLTFHCSGAFDLMTRYWKLNGGLPFEGFIIYWKDFIPDLTNHLIKKIKS